jgi:hypothetical protein
MTHRRIALSTLALGLAAAAACEGPTTGPNRLTPAAPSLNAQGGGGSAYSCTDLAYDGTFHDVVVPAGESCILAYGTVGGTLTVLDGASVYVVGTHIEGNVESHNAGSLELAEAVIDGDVIIEGDAGTAERQPSYVIGGVTLTRGDIRIERNGSIRVGIKDNDILAGDLRIQNNADSFISVIAMRVGRAIHVVGNRGAGSTMVRSSTAGQMIRCGANTASFTAAGNDAPLMQGQCERAAEVE